MDREISLCFDNSRLLWRRVWTDENFYNQLGKSQVKVRLWIKEHGSSHFKEPTGKLQALVSSTISPLQPNALASHRLSGKRFVKFVILIIIIRLK